MRKATVTYVAPIGDSKVVEWGGHTFTDGKAVEINSYDNPHMMEKLAGNQYFDVKMGKEDDSEPPKVKRGRPSNADIAAAKAAAEQAERDEKAAKEKNAAAKSDLEKITKAPDKEVTKAPTEGPKADMKAGMLGATGHDFEKDRQAEVARRDAQAKSNYHPDQYQGGAQNALNKSDPAV